MECLILYLAEGRGPSRELRQRLAELFQPRIHLRVIQDFSATLHLQPCLLFSLLHLMQHVLVDMAAVHLQHGKDDIRASSTSHF